MRRPPRNPREPLFGTRLLISAAMQGLTVLAAITILYFLILENGFSEERARAVAFAALVFSNVGLILSNRSVSRSVLATLRMPNKALWWVVGGAIGGLAAALYVPPLQRVFGFQPLAWYDLGFALIAASAGVLWTELIRLLPARPARSAAEVR
jgi:Ca2+-transporting ATPase